MTVFNPKKPEKEVIDTVGEGQDPPLITLRGVEGAAPPTVCFVGADFQSALNIIIPS